MLIDNSKIWFNISIPIVKDRQFNNVKNPNDIIYIMPDKFMRIIDNNRRKYRSEQEYYFNIKRLFNPKRDLILTLNNTYFEICANRNIKFDLFHPYFRIYYLSDYFTIKKFSVCEFINIFNTTIGYSLMLYRSINDVYSSSTDSVDTYYIKSEINKDLAGNLCSLTEGHKWRYKYQPFKLHEYDDKSIHEVIFLVKQKYNMINWTLPLVEIMFIFNYIHTILEVNGCIFIQTKTIYKQINVEIISHLTRYFQSVNIIKTSEEYSEIMIIVCFNYNGAEIEEIRNGYYNLSSQISAIERANNLNLQYKCDFINNMVKYMDETDEFRNELNKEMYIGISKIYTELNIPIIEFFGIDKIFNDKKTLRLKTLIYTFKQPNSKKSQLTKVKENTISEFRIRMFTNLNYITLNKENGFYQTLKNIENFKISSIIKNVFYKSHKYKISQAYLKCYEILRFLNIKKNITTFHVCEAPGQFILAFRDYCKRMNIKYDWTAQSLNASMFNSNNAILGDAYGLIAENPDKWLFGPNSTGDITNIDNVRYYISLPKCDISTSDCGFQIGVETDYENGDVFYKIFSIMIGQYLSLVNTINIGGTCFFKIFMPCTHKGVLILLQFLYIKFREITYFKPFLNSESTEFYIIAHDLIKPFTVDENNFIFKILLYSNKQKNFDEITDFRNFIFYKEFLDVHIIGINKIFMNYYNTVNFMIYLSLVKNGEEIWSKLANKYSKHYRQSIKQSKK